MSEPADTLTGSRWGDRVALAVLGLVFGIFMLPSAIDPGPVGMYGVDWRIVGIGTVSAAFWAAVVWLVGPTAGVL